MNRTLEYLRRSAREIFADALRELDPAAAVRRAVSLEGARLRIVEHVFDLDSTDAPEIYSIAFGKAAGGMAAALDEILGDRLAGGVLSSTTGDARVRPRWQTYTGGHPLPNEASLTAARSAFELLRAADERRALVIFLVSGGGSAMLEWPRREETTLAELREMNASLVSCGASITEINAVRRAVSAVKAGGLSERAPRAAQVSLIISDTSAGDEANVASGPTFPAPQGMTDARAVVARYNLESRLPASILRAIEEHHTPTRGTTLQQNIRTMREHYVLLENADALEHAGRSALARGFAVEFARDLVEQPVSEGADELVARLSEWDRRRRAEGRAERGVEGKAEGRGLCLISGGEFACPVRGNGVGGRNAETTLRCAIGMEKRVSEAARSEHQSEATAQMVALSAGTDGIDGNSPAAGALADTETLKRARTIGFDAQHALDESDAYTFFQALGDALMTGPTGTNVRDLRIVLTGRDEK